ncbi:MAG TPA: PAS domain-containing sensor histidine kinase [Kofleriaceae bacterium]|nr:PAS domain-containing sensor histidine kinase [Kofleriaceae bacterium]
MLEEMSEQTSTAGDEVTVASHDGTTWTAREHEELYRALASQLPNGAAFVVDTALRYRLADGEGLRAVGMQPADFEGKSIRDVIPAQHVDEYERHYRGALRGVPFHVEHQGHNNRHYITHGVPLRRSTGEIYAALAISYDITDRKQAEQARVESEHRFRTMADGTPIIIWVTDGSGAIEFVNRYYCEFFSTTVEAVRTGGWQPLVHADDAAQYVGAFETALREHREFRATARVRRGDGAWRWIESSGVPRYSSSGEFLGMVGSSPDITERKLAELELRDTLRMNELFIGVLGHDLRNPLGAVVTGAELALADPASPIARKALRRVISSADRMRRMIDQLLDVTRIRSGGGLVMQCVHTDLVAIAKTTADELEPAHEAVTFSLDAAGDATGSWDPDRIAQLVSNLLGNAAQHATGSGVVRVQIDASEPDVVSLAVHNGGAIAPELIPVLFEPFQRGERAAGRKGLGLGLYISREIARAHGGELRVTSSAEAGTTFELVLPRDQSRQNAPS